MEQTVNTFSKGLQMDTHPMVQGNDTLSNALNATFVTMNGNEVILQNDMGNRRVDGAFLPAGYEPVGIKEHGGIIYIASYNPITNKCQIGSFPSPQMNYGKEDGISSDIDEDLFNQSFTESDFGEVQFQRNFSILSPFRKTEEGKKSTKDEILHGGDKFCVYFSEDTSFNEKISYFNNWIATEPEELITNYNNTNYNTDGDRDRLYSPKNKKYTLSLGVMNSQNQFTDFTPTLLRWEQYKNVYKIIEFDSNTPDYIKFNSGYFIPRSFNSDDLSETISDAQFIRNRLKLPANTYVYKLAGPLYIKKDLNVISNMTFNYYGSEVKGDNGSIKYKISLDIFYEYNCPDFLSFIGTQDSDNKYFTYENNPSNTTECLIGSNIKLVKYEDGESINWNTENNGTIDVWREISDFVETGSKTTYNPVTNTYKLKKHYVWKNNYVEEGEKCLLRIVPFTSYGLGIRNLSRLVLIDYDKLKTNELSISDFRFKREGNQMTICLGFVGYMAGIGGISNIKLEILSDDGNSAIVTKGKNDMGDPQNTGIIGIHTLDIPFDSNFEERRIYLAKISWSVDNSVTPLAAARIIDFDDNDDEEEQETTPTTPTTQEEQEITSTNTSTQVEYRWIVTTDLFNDFYEGENIVMDYGNSSTYTDKFKEVLKVKPKITVINPDEDTTFKNVYSINEEIGIYSSDTNPKNKQINYVQVGNCKINNKKIKLELDDSYPKEITATFAYNNKNNIGVSVNYTSNEVETEVKINNLDNYSKTDFGLRQYNDYTTNGFNSDRLTVTRDENGYLNINYDGTFLIREYSKGIFGTRKVTAQIENVFRSIFETELTEEKLFDQCGVVEVFHGWWNTTDYSDDNRRTMIAFSFQSGDEEQAFNVSKNNILQGSMFSSKDIFLPVGHTTYYAEDNSRHHCIINYPNTFKIYNGETRREKTEYETNDIYKVLNDEVFQSYITEFQDKPNFKFEFRNKNFIIGTTMQTIVTSFRNNHRKEGDPEYEQFRYCLRPIILWMRIGSESQRYDWAMLPLVDVNGFIDELWDQYSELHDKDNVELVKYISENLIKKYGYLGNNQQLMFKIRGGEKDGNKLILEYLKSRIKNFYYKCNNSEEQAEFYKLNQIEHIYYFDDSLKLTPKLEIEISRNVTEKLTASLKNNGINQVFKTDINEVTKEDISDKDLTISFTSKKPEVSELENTINSINTLKYALCENGNYYVTLNGQEFEEGDKNKIIIKDERGNFERLENDLIYSDSGRTGNDYYFPYIVPSYNVPSGIGLIEHIGDLVPESPTTEWIETETYLEFDFQRNGNQFEPKDPTDPNPDFPPTIPQSLLK